MVDLKAHNGATSIVSWGALARVMQERGYSDEEIAELVTATEPQPITLQDASERYGVPKGTLQRWVHERRLKVIAREVYAAPGGGKLLLDEIEVQALVSARPKRGRPAKVSEEPHVLTVKEASEKYSIPVPTLHYWLQSGRLDRKGLRRSKVTRPSILIDEDQLRYLLGHREETLTISP